MTTRIKTVAPKEVVYPSGDGKPVAETYSHFIAIITTLLVLKQYLFGQQATVLGNQFLYYIQGNPRARVAPDVMVIFNVKPGGRDNYKTWEEGEVPRVIFEMTSASTKNVDQEFKKMLYAQLGVEEYWLFDPRQEWLDERLKGYRLVGEDYQLMTETRSEVLGLRLEVQEQLISFYREDTGEKLLMPQELATTLEETQQQLEIERQRAEFERQRAEAERQQAEAERQQAAQLESLLAQYRDRFGNLPE
jgi:Putative restriction endonuclease